jgi:enoyl-CoA hydratase/carnithine racemase
MSKNEIKPFLYTREGGLAILSINDAPWNKMTLEFMDELETLIPKLKEDSSIRAVLFTAEGEENR